MRTIWKYELPSPLPLNNVSQWLTVPASFRPLSAGVAQNILSLWGEVQAEDDKTKELSVFIQGTGSDLRHIEKEQFVGTVVDGHYVWHIYVGDALKRKGG